MEWSCKYCEFAKSKLTIQEEQKLEYFGGLVPKKCKQTNKDITKNILNHSIDVDCPRLKGDWKDLKKEWIIVEGLENV